MNLSQWHDAKNLLSKFTMPRALNAVKTFSSYYYSKLLKQPTHWGKPISVSIEPTTSCNLRCPECPSGLRSFTRATGMLEENFFRKMIDELSEQLLYLIFYFQGEPYLNPEFLEMVKYASQKKIYTATSTNAHYLDDKNAQATIESGLDRLIRIQWWLVHFYRRDNERSWKLRCKFFSAKRTSPFPKILDSDTVLPGNKI